MAGRRVKAKKTGGGGAQAARRAKSVLGNDPFERGAASRPADDEPKPASAPATVPGLAATEPAISDLDAGTEPATSDLDAGTEPATSDLDVGPEPADAEPGSSIAEPQPGTGAGDAPVEPSLTPPSTSAASRLVALEREEAAGQHTRDLLRLVARLLPALRERAAALVALGSLFVGTRELDDFGMDRELADRAMPVLDFLYGTWWRVEVRQIENVPDVGPTVIVANHGGVLAWDALVLRTALLRDHAAHRDLRPLLDDHALAMPVVGRIMARLGAVAAKPEHAWRLLEGGGAVATFPEGSSGATRPWPDRYRIQRFGRGGFAKLALRSSATIVPCAIVGSEETSLPIARAGWLSDLLGMPFLKSPPARPLAALGVLPLPARWSLRFGPPIETAPLGPDAADNPGQVLELTERVRSTLQQMLDEDVAARGSVYL